MYKEVGFVVVFVSISSVLGKPSDESVNNDEVINSRNDEKNITEVNTVHIDLDNDEPKNDSDSPITSTKSNISTENQNAADPPKRNMQPIHIDNIFNEKNETNSPDIIIRNAENNTDEKNVTSPFLETVTEEAQPNKSLRNISLIETVSVNDILSPTTLKYNDKLNDFTTDSNISIESIKVQPQSALTPNEENDSMIQLTPGSVKEHSNLNDSHVQLGLKDDAKTVTQPSFNAETTELNAFTIGLGTNMEVKIRRTFQESHKDIIGSTTLNKSEIESGGQSKYSTTEINSEVKPNRRKIDKIYKEKDAASSKQLTDLKPTRRFLGHASHHNIDSPINQAKILLTNLYQAPITIAKHHQHYLQNHLPHISRNVLKGISPNLQGFSLPLTGAAHYGPNKEANLAKGLPNFFNRRNDDQFSRNLETADGGDYELPQFEDDAFVEDFNYYRKPPDNIDIFQDSGLSEKYYPYSILNKLISATEHVKDSQSKISIL